ncbi:MAG: glycine hydroxymethyltransferase [Rhabdochlamydiaceae bacterium]
MNHLDKYLERTGKEKRSSAVIACLASLDHIYSTHPQIGEAILKELKEQKESLKLIASENYSSFSVQLSMGNWLTDKYAEGIPFHRFYAGCENVDLIEQLAIDKAKKIFGAEHAYVQPHSGADANLVAYWAILVHKIQNRKMEEWGKKSLDELSTEEYESIRQLMLSQKIMGLSLNSGGHLTHGYRHNISSKMMKSVSFDVDPSTNKINYQTLKQQVLEEKPLILVIGYSAYPRLIDFSVMKEIADSVGAVLMVDMAHFSGLVAGEVFRGVYNPIPYADIVTTTTHKTLRGPRGGMVLCKSAYKDVVNKGCPLVLGGPLPHVLAAKAIAFQEADTPHFKDYAHQIVKNAQALAERLRHHGIDLLTGGTDNHLLVIDVYKSFGLTGRQAENALRLCGFTVNRNAVPFDKNGPWYTSGIRIGTPAVTTLGMKEKEMEDIADGIFYVLKRTQSVKIEGKEEKSLAKIHIDPAVVEEMKTLIGRLGKNFPLYPELDIEF